MSFLDAIKLPTDAPLKQVIDGKLHWHIKALRKWEKNEEYRMIREDGWERLKRSVKKNGIKDAWQIDEMGTIYDGNNRYEAIQFWLANGEVKSDNGKSFEWIPVEVHRVPQSETEALEIAVKGNGDKDFAIWNKDAVVNHKDVFDQIEDIDDMVFNFDDAETFDDSFEYLENEGEGDEEKEEKQKKEKKVICPKCQHEFIAS